MSVTVLPQSRPLTAADLETMPDDGHRYELIDGTLIVTPSPSVPHQRAVGNLHVELRRRCLATLEVMLAPLDVTFSQHTVLQPDLLVASREALAGRTMQGGPVLAIEVLSPSTRLVDLTLKLATYEREGTRAYWVVDPLVPSITAWQLGDSGSGGGRSSGGRSSGGYVQVAHAVVDGVFRVEFPYEVELTPAALLA